MTANNADTTEAPTEDELTDLTGFQRDVVLCLGQEGPQKGVSILSWLGEHGYDDPNHGRLYPNLDDLKQQGFVSKTERDKRTNEYALTRRGRAIVDANAAAWQTAQSEIGARGD